MLRFCEEKEGDNVAVGRHEFKTSKVSKFEISELSATSSNDEEVSCNDDKVWNEDNVGSIDDTNSKSIVVAKEIDKDRLLDSLVCFEEPPLFAIELVNIGILKSP
jgi:hypothetical protein